MCSSPIPLHHQAGWIPAFMVFMPNPDTSIQMLQQIRLFQSSIVSFGEAVQIVASVPALSCTCCDLLLWLFCKPCLKWSSEAVWPFFSDLWPLALTMHFQSENCHAMHISPFSAYSLQTFKMIMWEDPSRATVYEIPRPASLLPAIMFQSHWNHLS